MTDATSALLSRLAFLALLVAVAIPSPWMSPPLALALGLGFGLIGRHPYPAPSRTAARVLLQVSVVALGFGMNLEQVLRTGQDGFVYTLAGIGFALGAGTLLGRWLRVPARSSYLIAVGTAICGGSAIAAVGPTLRATDEEMSVALGTVFLLNAVALVVFPPIGHAIGLTESQFGLWAALAIHDTSSVVGAGAKYGAVALAVATSVKLARALWIVPLTLITARLHRGEPAVATARAPWPWFILAFLGAAMLATYIDAPPWLYARLLQSGRIGLTVTLFLIGTGISRRSLAEVGVRPLTLGVALWAIVASASLFAIHAGWIS